MSDRANLKSLHDDPASFVPANFPELQNTTVLDAALCKPVSHIPVWVHRQAGRYLPEYKATRATAGSFFSLCQTPELACEVTLQPIRRFPLDAAIIFSDILVVPQALGLEVQMIPGKGPSFPNPLKDPDDMKRLKTRDTIDVKKDLGYVFKALTLTRHSLCGVVPLLGFTGAPWTLFAYMTEGGGAKTFSVAKSWLYKWPESSHAILQLLTDTIVQYLTEQVRAGAQMLEVFDSWAGDLSSECFLTFSLPYLAQIAERTKKSLQENGLPIVPMTVFAKGVCEHLSLLRTHTIYDVVSVDWVVSPATARKAFPVASSDAKQRSVCLQGNLDMSVLYASDDTIREQVAKMGTGFGHLGYIANLGHGMLPSHDPEKLAVMINAVHQLPVPPPPAETQDADENIHASRVTILPKDIQLARRIRGERA